MSPKLVQALKGAAYAVVALLVALGVIPGTEGDTVKAVIEPVLAVIALVTVPPHQA